MTFNRRLQSVFLKEIKEIYRDKIYLAMALVVPLILMILFGLGLTLDVKNIPTAVLDQNRSPQSREYVARVTRSRYFTLENYLTDVSPIDQKLTEGKIRLGLIIPPNFDRTLALGQASEVQALIDGAFPDRAATIRSYLEAINLDFNQELASRWGMATGQTVPYIEVETRAWFNSDLESKNFIVPGLVAVLLMMICAMLTAITISREKETGTLEQILASPVQGFEIIIGKVIPYILLAFLVGGIVVNLYGSFVRHSSEYCNGIGINVPIFGYNKLSASKNCNHINNSTVVGQFGLFKVKFRPSENSGYISASEILRINNFRIEQFGAI